VMVGLVLAGCAGIYVLTRLVAGSLAGALAVILAIGSAAVFPFVDHVTADDPGLPFAVWGLVLAAVAWRGRRSLWLSAGAGACVAASVSIKYSMVTALAGIVALAVVAKPGRRDLLAFVGGAAVVAGALLVAYRNDLQPLWRDSVTLHTEARKIAPRFAGVGGTSGLSGNAHQIWRVLKERSPLDCVLLAIGAVGAFGWAVTAWRGRERAQLWILAWPVASLLFLLWQAPLFDQHLALLAIAGAPVAAIGLVWGARLVRPLPLVASGLAAALVVVAWVQALDRHFANEPRRVRNEVRLVDAVTKPGDMVVASDDTIVPFYARRPVPPDLVDTSTVRLLTGSLTTEDILRIVDRAGVVAVLAGKRFDDRALLAGFRRRYVVAKHVPFGTLWSGRRVG
jgi:hypothetical protein